jgi:hypothetical protein
MHTHKHTNTQIEAVLTKFRKMISDRVRMFGALSDIMVARQDKLPVVVFAPVQPVHSQGKKRKIVPPPRVALEGYLDFIYFHAEPVIESFNRRHEHIEYASIGADRLVTFQQVFSRTPIFSFQLM